MKPRSDCGQCQLMAGDAWSDRCYVAISAHARARKRTDPCSFGGFMLLCCSVGHSRQSRQQVGGLLLAVIALWMIPPPKVRRACPFLPGAGPRWDTAWTPLVWDRTGHPGAVRVLAKRGQTGSTGALRLRHYPAAEQLRDQGGQGAANLAPIRPGGDLGV